MSIHNYNRKLKAIYGDRPHYGIPTALLGVYAAYGGGDLCGGQAGRADSGMLRRYVCLPVLTSRAAGARGRQSDGWQRRCSIGVRRLVQRQTLFSVPEAR